MGPFALRKFSREMFTNEEKFVPLLDAKRKKLTVPSFENYYGKGTKKRRKTEKKKEKEPKEQVNLFFHLDAAVL